MLITRQHRKQINDAARAICWLHHCEIGSRRALEGPDTRTSYFNLAFLEGKNTDLVDMLRLSDTGLRIAETTDGRVVLDVYVYERSGFDRADDMGNLVDNLTVRFQDGRIVSIDHSQAIDPAPAQEQLQQQQAAGPMPTCEYCGAAPVDPADGMYCARCAAFKRTPGAGYMPGVAEALGACAAPPTPAPAAHSFTTRVDLVRRYRYFRAQGERAHYSLYLARAEMEARRRGWYVAWAPDDSCFCSESDVACACLRGACECEYASLWRYTDTDSERLNAALGGICGADDPYRRVVAAELYSAELETERETRAAHDRNAAQMERIYASAGWSAL